MANFIVNDIKQILNGQNHLSKLILINAVVFLALNIALAFVDDETGYVILTNIGLPAGLLSSLTHFWTYFTYMFVHQGFFHFLFNMLWLFWMGRIMADLYGQFRVLNTYLYGGLVGGILFVLFSSIPGFISGSFLIGASGGVLAVMVATAALLPDYTLNLLFIGPVKLKYIALVGFILSTLLDFDVNTGGKIAHIGGAAFGLLYGVRLTRGQEITDPINNFLKRIWDRINPSNRSRMRVVHRQGSSKRTDRSASQPNQASMTESEKQRKTDEILDKISKSGYDSLSKDEKDFLFKMSNH